MFVMHYQYILTRKHLLLLMIAYDGKYNFYSLIEIHYIVTNNDKLCNGYQLEAYFQWTAKFSVII